MKAAPHIRMNDGGPGMSSLEDDEEFEARKHEWQVDSQHISLLSPPPARNCGCITRWRSLFIRQSDAVKFVKSFARWQHMAGGGERRLLYRLQYSRFISALFQQQF